MDADDLRELEHKERDTRRRAREFDTDWARREARDAELTTYRAEMGDEVDD